MNRRRVVLATIACLVCCYHVKPAESWLLQRRSIQEAETDVHSRTKAEPHVGHRIARSLLHAILELGHHFGHHGHHHYPHYYEHHYPHHYEHHYPHHYEHHYPHHYEHHYPHHYEHHYPHHHHHEELLHHHYPFHHHEHAEGHIDVHDVHHHYSLH